ncbi:MAG TPA: dockerin type I domain-containing protein [Acetivibrio sp.]|uniref:dockerin type I domain-containing protein n=1 Tax=Acetivibrio sp. TaxID=1872092 RepID=UPI002BBCA70F|nr:dockerin type I domain-containing protein [Acetivibrio sp.]HOM03639.1 dockerin type I domain-containing protein [Acetivibrio sp.]
MQKKLLAKMSFLLVLSILVSILAITSANADSDLVGYGDLNGDGKINSTDLNLMRRYLIKSVDLNENQLEAADVNLDGKVTSTDRSVLNRYLLKMIDCLPFTGVETTPESTPLVTYPWTTPTPDYTEPMTSPTPTVTQPKTSPTPVVTQPTSTPTPIDVQTPVPIAHEAEAESNNLKDARVESDYVVFDEIKDAYLEMTQVASPVSDEVIIIFIYSNGSDKSLPMEIEVNGEIIESNIEFPSTGSWDTWSSISVKANMNIDPDNIIKIKTCSDDGGPRIDKVLISSFKPIPTPTPTSTTD